MKQKIPSYIEEYKTYVRWGGEAAKLSDRELTAIHEAAHFVVAYSKGLGRGETLTIDETERYGGLFGRRKIVFDALLDAEIDGKNLRTVASEWGDADVLLSKYEAIKRDHALVRMMIAVAGAVAANIIGGEADMPSEEDERQAQRAAKFLDPQDPWRIYDLVCSTAAECFDGPLQAITRKAAKRLLEKQTLRGTEVDELWQELTGNQPDKFSRT